MSEKRFEFYSDEDLIGVLDTVTGKTFNSLGIVDVLNEQQATISALKEENEQLSKEHQEMLEKYVLLRLKIGEVLNDE